MLRHTLILFSLFILNSATFSKVFDYQPQQTHVAYGGQFTLIILKQLSY